jgi:hypothetical protein
MEQLASSSSIAEPAAHADKAAMMSHAPTMTNW